MDFSETIVVFETSNRRLKWQEVSVDIKPLSPGGCLSPAPRLCTCIKSLKNCIKSKRFFCIWRQMGKGIRLFCCHQDVAPSGLSATAPGLYTCIKSWKKKLYKIRLQRHCFETCNKWTKWQDVFVDIKTLSPGGCLPLPWGYIHVLDK